MKRNLTKISITVPPEMVDDLAYLTSRLGVSRSALIAGLMGDSLPAMRKVLEQVPLDPTQLSGPELVRMRGESEQIIRDRIASLGDITDDLFSR
jgi:hypothetical protein